MKKKEIGALAIGAAIGVGAGVLLAPKSGKDTREDLKNITEEFLTKVKNIKLKDVKEDFNKKIKELEQELKSLDKERVLEIAKEKATAIKIKADDLVDFAIEKKEKALSKTAEEFREKAILVTKDILAKLEDK